MSAIGVVGLLHFIVIGTVQPSSASEKSETIVSRMAIVKDVFIKDSAISDNFYVVCDSICFQPTVHFVFGKTHDCVTCAQALCSWRQDPFGCGLIGYRHFLNVFVGVFTNSKPDNSDYFSSWRYASIFVPDVNLN